VPEDVWLAADAVGEAIHGRHERGWVAWPLITEGGLSAQEHVARAMLSHGLSERAAERERCARKVETALREDYERKTGQPRGLSEAEVFLAAAIREPR
jgi:hypothetical protein